VHAQNQLTNSQTPITIGISLSFSGDFKDDGQAMKQGNQLWMDTVNNNGGLLGRPVKLIILDDKSDPDQVAKNYATLIHTDHIDLVFGPFSSLLMKAAVPVVRDAGYTFIEGAGGAPSVFSNGWKNLFAVSCRSKRT
jgi:branched-chain amino acid transport system substrate-binding protein